MQFRYGTERFPKEVLEKQDGKKIPFTLEPGGPVIGEATLKYVPEEEAIIADVTVTDDTTREFLEGNTADFMGLPAIFDRRKES